MFKRIMAMALTVCMLVMIMPYGVSADDTAVVAEAGNVVEVATFDELSSALSTTLTGESAENPTTVVVMNDIDFTSTANVNGYKVITSNKSVTLTRSVSNTMIQVNSGAELTVEGKLVFDGAYIVDGEAAMAGSVIYADNTVLTINDGTFKNAYGDLGAAVAVKWANGVLNINGGTFTNNTASSSGGAVWIFQGALNITDGIFSNNTAGAHGGAVFSEGTTNITGGTFSGNVAGQHGGVIYHTGGNTLDISGGTFDSNMTTGAYDSHGGAVASFTSPINVSGGTYTNNKASNSGGAIWFFNTVANITGGTLSGNTAGQGGAGIYNEGTALNLSGDFTASMSDDILLKDSRTLTVAGELTTDSPIVVTKIQDGAVLSGEADLVAAAADKVCVASGDTYYKVSATGEVTNEEFVIEPEVTEEPVATDVPVTYAAEVNGVGYETLAEAVAAAEAGQTVKLLADVADAGNVTVKAGVTLDGAGYTISGNSAVYVAKDGATVIKNVNFNNISNGSKLTAIYATGLTDGADVTITGCTFTDVEYEAMQITTQETAADITVTVTNNTFKDTDDTAIPYRYVHVQGTGAAAKGFNMDLTVTGNKMYTNNTVAAAMGIYYINSDATMDLTGNYVDYSSKNSVMLVDNGTTVNGIEEILPLKDETLTSEITYAATVAKANLWEVALYETFEAALAAATTEDTVKIFETVVIDEDTTLDLGGKTVVGVSNAEGEYVDAFTILADVTVKNGTVDTRNSGYTFYVGSNETAGNLTIESGNFYGDVTVVNVRKGTANIKGGYYEATPYNGEYDFTVNCIDANYKNGTASVNITGGTFYGFNPADNAAEGTATNFAADGYVGVDLGEGLYGVEEKQVPTGSITPAYLTKINVPGSTGVWGEAQANANESFVIELYADDVKMASASLNNIGGIIDGDVAVTWNILFPGSNDEYWDVVWTEGHPNKNAAPTKVVLVADGVAVAENVFIANSPDDMNELAWEDLEIFKEYVAEVGGVEYESLAEALDAAEAGQTVTLLADVADAGNVTVKAGVTLDGAGYTISGNSAVYVATTGATVIKNVNFKDIHNEAGKLTPIYATGLTDGADVTITGCTFDNVDWDAMQITTNEANADIKVTVTGNTFTNTDNTPAYRYIHVQGPATGYNMNLTVTGNKMDTNDGAVAAGMGIYYISSDAEMNLAGNYVDNPSKNSVMLVDNGTVINGVEEILPLKDETLTNDVAYAAAVVKASLWEVALYETFEAALAAATTEDTVKVLETVIIDKDMTLDLGGKTITSATGYNKPIFRIQGDANVTVTNGTVDTGINFGYGFILGASDGSSAGYLTITDGTYHCQTAVASVTKGTLTVEGGEFSVKPYNGNYNYLFNCVDANYKDGSANVVVKGGTFHNFDPADNAAEGTGTSFVADGYISVDNGNDTYRVKLDYSITITADNKVVTTGVEESAVVVLASYNGTRLVDVQYVAITEDADMAIADTELVTDGATSISAMLLKDMTNIMPLCAGAVK